MNTKLVILVAMVTLALQGCSVLQGAAPQVAKAVNRYCAEPLQERLLVRGQVNQMITPNTIKVTCEGDPE